MWTDNICPSCKSSANTEEVGTNPDGSTIQYYCKACKMGWVVNTERASVFIFRAEKQGWRTLEKSSSENSDTFIRRNPPKPMTICPICKTPIHVHNLERHNQKVHKITPSPKKSSNQNQKVSSLPNDTKSNKPMTICPICKALVRTDRLNRHKQKVHKIHLTSSVSQQDKQSDTYKSGTGRLNKLSSQSSQSEHDEEAFNQSLYESRFGEKYMGQLNRDWDGTFGSLPLYDDYGDEANAE